VKYSVSGVLYESQIQCFTMVHATAFRLKRVDLSIDENAVKN